MEEIASLSTSLPAGIYVRVDENRPDVIKALITGPQGTPYENGLFEFDFFLPHDYPTSPPKGSFLTTGES
jgi:baculoviral IAP repeat-containing protein 6